MTRILLIEDDQPFREVLVQMLTNDGHQVEAAADGMVALRLLKTITPELIITDVLMPNMDGIETIMEMSRSGNLVPIIAMSGGGRSVTPKFNLASAHFVGVTATLAKPFSHADLRRAIGAALRTTVSG